MQLWRFLYPSALRFTLKTTAQALVDRIKGAPSRPVQAAQYVSRHAQPDDPADVLRALDQFAQEERWLMSVGPKKGPLIKELAQRLPANARILELGAYCGYSSIMIATAFGPQARITSIEIDKDAVASSRANVAVAGLSEQITFVHGSSSKMIHSLRGRFDLVFLDHWKDLYKPDLQLIEQLDLIGPGSIVVADNVGKIFAPEAYLNYVRNCGHYDCEHREATIEYTSVPDAVEISVYR
ncbi:MAG: class I SAM-dependent methyltransferase [Halioglobus sp.]